MLEMQEVRIEERLVWGELGGLWVARGGLDPRPRDASFRSGTALLEHPRSEGACSFDEFRVVEEHEGLLRNIGTDAFCGAFFPSRGIEGEHGRMNEAALPPCIKTSPPLIRPL